MAGNPDNVSIWANADVYVLFPEDLPAGGILDAIPANIGADFSEDWGLVGLLDGDAGFEESAAWDKTEHPAWGYGIFKVAFKNFKMTRKYTALEDNPVTKKLRSKNDTATRVKISKPTEAYLAFETSDDEGNKHRLISTRPASNNYSGRTINESDLPSVEFEADILPNSEKELFIIQESPAAYAYTVTITGTPAGGTWKLGVDSAKTTPLAHNIVPSALQTALGALSNVTAVTVGGAAGAYTVSYTGPAPLHLADNSLSGGTSPGVTITQV